MGFVSDKFSIFLGQQWEGDLDQQDDGQGVCGWGFDQLKPAGGGDWWPWGSGNQCCQHSLGYVLFTLVESSGSFQGGLERWQDADQPCQEGVRSWGPVRWTWWWWGPVRASAPWWRERLSVWRIQSSWSVWGLGWIFCSDSWADWWHNGGRGRLGVVVLVTSPLTLVGGGDLDCSKVSHPSAHWKKLFIKTRSGRADV